MNNAPRYPNRKRPPVTIAIGFTTKVAVYFATDSQASYAGSTHMRPDEPKLALVDLTNGGKAIIAKIGTLDAADYFLEKFQAATANAVLSGPRSVADIAEVCMRETRSSLLANYKNESLPADAYLAQIQEYACKILLGYVWGGAPFIYTLGFESGWAVKSSRAFEAVGCGAGIASYVLSGFSFEKMQPDNAIGVMAYAVEMCKNHDAGCGGRTQIGLLYKENGSGGLLLNSQAAEMFEDASRKTEKDMRTRLTETLEVNMKKCGFIQ